MTPTNLAVALSGRVGRGWWSVVAVVAVGLMAAGCGESAPADAGTDPPAGQLSDLGRCQKDADCPAGLHCDVAASACVACLADRDCGDGNRCVEHACRPGCTRARGCGDAGVCEADAGACLECLRDADCHDGARPRCEVGAGRCRACLSQNDNCPAGDYCAADFTCQPGCRRDADCAGDAGPGHCLLAAHRCVACLVDNDCPPASVCMNNACVPGCTNGHGCGLGLSCCGGMCADPMSDAANCGGCGIACKPGLSCCGGLCADLANDPGHCGACGTVCSLPNAMAGCDKQACTIAACSMGWADCNKLSVDGCEVAVASDLANCGACGVSCAPPHANAACIGGMCSVGACTNGYLDCNHMPGDGCEIDGANDILNCGVCGSACKQLPHATSVCQKSACVITACDAGFGNCDKKDANGCEATLTSDASNCGACGKVCAGPPNVVVTCVNSACANGACKVGFGDCNMNPNDGCEANFGSDAANCGGCGKACAMGSVCVGGMCSAFYGGGQAGPLVVNGNSVFSGYQETHLAAGAAIGDTSISLASAQGMVVGDKLLVVCMRSGQGNAGVWEIADVVQVNQNTVKLAVGLSGAYPEPATTIVRTLPQYTTVNVNNGATLSAPAWDPVLVTGGIIAFFANASVTIDGTLQANGAGYRGGVGDNHDPNVMQWKTPGESYPGPGMSDNANNVANGGGGGGGGKRGFCEGSGGGGGGYASGGNAGGNNVIACGSVPGGVGGLDYGDAQLSRIYLGSGGGAGGYTTMVAQGAGGAGGGMIIVFAPKIVINGSMTANGADGTQEFGDYGGGGGGSGGSIYLRTQQNVVGGANVVVNGGAGGPTLNGRAEVGGAGSAGRAVFVVK